MEQETVTLTPDNVTEHITTEDQLRELENSLSEPRTSPEASVEGEEPAEPTGEQQTASTDQGQAETEMELSDEDLSLVKEIRALQSIEGTPYKSVADLIKGHKSLQGEFTKRNQSIKPYEPILEKLQNPEVKQYVESLFSVLDNPTLLQAYQNQVLPGDAEPDPRTYDMNDPEQYAQFKTQHSAWQQRQVNSIINTRLGQIETQNRLERQKFEFRQKFPDVDPDTLLGDWVKQVSQQNPLENLYKIREFDNIEQRVTEKVRKEFADKLNKAQQSTPKGNAASKQASINEILNHVAQYSVEAAEKRYGKDVVAKALRQLT